MGTRCVSAAAAAAAVALRCAVLCWLAPAWLTLLPSRPFTVELQAVLQASAVLMCPDFDAKLPAAAGMHGFRDVRYCDEVAIGYDWSQHIKFAANATANVQYDMNISDDGNDNCGSGAGSSAGSGGGDYAPVHELAACCSCIAVAALGSHASLPSLSLASF